MHAEAAHLPGLLGTAASSHLVMPEKLAWTAGEGGSQASICGITVWDIAAVSTQQPCLVHIHHSRLGEVLHARGAEHGQLRAPTEYD